jgi:hypothetical protein
VPHAFRAATIAPLYALLVGMGIATLWQAAGRLPQAHVRQWLRLAGAGCALALLLWQAGDWQRAYLRFAADQTARYQDGLLETMALVVRYAPGYDEVWVDTHLMNEAHIFLLAAQPLPPAQAQAQTVLTRQPPDFNKVWRIERYRFSEHPPGIPEYLPTLAALPDRFGGPAFVLQEWHGPGARRLVLRRVYDWSAPLVAETQRGIGTLQSPAP